jgi:hypothetical protein
MRRFLRSTAVRLGIALGCVCLSTLSAPAQVSLRSVKILNGKETVEIEVEASDRIVPQTQVLSGPDRLVVDFPNAIPGNQLHSQSVDRGDVKSVRVGLYQSKPPVTRLVVDLKSARSYQIFPSGRTVMIKVMGGASAADDSSAANVPAKRAALVAATYTTKTEPVQVANAPRTPLEVTFRNGSLSIVANKATLSEVLFAVQQRTGADISIPAGAEQEHVVAELGPAPAPEVLARLLNGSNFNFLILSAPDNPGHVDRVILSPRDSGEMSLAPMQSTEQAPDEDAAPAEQPASDVAAVPTPAMPQDPQNGQPAPPAAGDDPN